MLAGYLRGHIVPLLLMVPAGVLSTAASAQEPVHLMGPGATTNITPLGLKEPQALPDALAQPGNALVMQSRSLRARYGAVQERIREMRQRASRASVDAIRATKEAELEEVRKGLFCSGCGLTRSQILAQGDPFPHPGQRIVRATSEQIATKQREIERAIQAAEERRADARASLVSLEREREDLTQDGEVLAMNWVSMMRNEDAARAQAWETLLGDYKQEVARTQEVIDSTKTSIERGIANGASKDPIQIDVYKNKLAEGHMENIRERAQQDVAKYREQLASFDRALAGGREELGQTLNETGGRMIIPPTLPALSSMRMPGTPLSVATSQDSVTLAGGLNFGDVASKSVKLRASLNASSNWLRGTMRISVGFEAQLPLLGGVSVGMEQLQSSDGQITSQPFGQRGKPEPPTATDLMTQPAAPAEP